MKIGSLVMIKESGDPKLIGTYGLVERFVEFIEGDYVVIHRLVDGRKDSYHPTKLEVLT